MARQEGWVQLEQSDMHLTLNMAKMTTGGFSRAAAEETEQLIKKPRGEVRDEKTRGVEFPGHKSVKATMEWHLAMVYKNLIAGCLPCQNGTAENLQTRWRRKGTAAPLPEPVPPLPGRPSSPVMPPEPPGDTEVNECYEIEGMTSTCVYMYSPLPITQFVNHNACAMDSKRDKDSIPDILSALSAVW